MASKNKIRIGYVSHYDHYRMGGQKSMLALIENLDRTKYEPYCILPREGELAEKLRTIECPPIFVELLQLKPRNYSKLPAAPKNYREVIQEYNFDIIHPDSPADAFLFGLAKKRTKAKLIWHVRLTGGALKDKLYERLADGIIGISDACKLRFPNTERFNKKYITIFNGVDTELFRPVDKSEMKEKLDFPKDELMILFAGVLKESKGIIDLVEAVNLLKIKLPNTKFKVIMAGKESKNEIMNKLCSLIDNYKLQSTISLVGQQYNINEWMQAADLLVLPSHEGSEGMGRVIFEAMACGTVPIGSDISGVNEAITDDSGLLFKEKDFEDLSEKMMTLIENNDLRTKMEIAARQRAVEVFDIRVHASKVMDFYTKILSL